MNRRRAMRRRRRDRRAARQGDADRLDDQAAPRGGAPGAARRSQPDAGCGRSTTRRSRELADGAVARPARRARPAWRCPSTTDESRAKASCGWPRPSWWAGSRGCSTASRRRLFAQQMAARAQLEQMRQRSLPAGADEPAAAGPAPTSERLGPCGHGLARRRDVAARIVQVRGQLIGPNHIPVVHPQSCDRDCGRGVSTVDRRRQLRRGRSFTHLHTAHRVLDARRRGAGRRGGRQAAAPTASRRIGITDHGNMYGVLDFYKACREPGINADHRHRGLHGRRVPLRAPGAAGPGRRHRRRRRGRARSSTTT